MPPPNLALLFVASHKNGSPAPAPDLAPPSPDLPPLRGWTPARLPDDLEGATIEIKTRGGEILIRTIVEVIERNADFVLVRDSGKP